MSEAAWLAALLEFRARKDAYFASGRGPLTPDTLKTFSGLAYYPPDAAWNLHLPLERLPAEIVMLPTSTPGQMQAYTRWGRVNLPGDDTLTLYARYADKGGGDTSPEALFVPFRDATSGGATYGAGRSLDAPLGGSVVTLDFNRAYSPYCAYSDAWICPLPPEGNWLSVAVEAGERVASSEPSASGR